MTRATRYSDPTVEYDNACVAAKRIAEEAATEAAARLNLTLGRDNKWRGRCPACGYHKPTLEVGVEHDRIAVCCNACGATTAIAAAMGVSSDLVTKPTVRSSKVAGALDAWRKATPAAGSLIEAYLKSRGITLPPPPSIRFLPRQRNWNDGKTYPTMIALVQRVPSADDYAALGRHTDLRMDTDFPIANRNPD